MIVRYKYVKSMNWSILRLTICLFILITGFQEARSAKIEIAGVPFVKNFYKTDYRASTQNWAIAQGSTNEFMYFANNQGVLQYTGYEWHLMELPNLSIVRSLVSLSGDSVLVGAYNEFGVLAHDSLGQMVYHSWINKLPANFRNFNEVWRIYAIDDLYIFQSFSGIMLFKGNRFFKIIKPEVEFRFSFVVDGKYYIQEWGKGLMVLDEDHLELIDGGSVYAQKEVWSIIRINADQLLICCQHGGNYVYSDGQTTAWNTPAGEFLEKNNLFSAVKLKNQRLAFGTVANGLIISDLNGNILLNINKQNGLQNNTILSLTEDNSHNLWLGLDNGIDYVEINLPLSYIRQTGGFGTGYSSIVFNNKLYAGTNEGLFCLDLNQKVPNAAAMLDFKFIENTNGQVWKMINISNLLVCAHNSGLFIIDGYKASLIPDLVGVWDIAPVPNHQDLFIAGTYHGFYIFQIKDGKLFMRNKVEGFNESSRRYFFDDAGNIWMSHSYKGVFRLKIADGLNYFTEIKLFDNSTSLPSDYNNEVYFIRHKILVTTREGIYEYDTKKQNFIQSTLWDRYLGGHAGYMTNLIEGNDKKIWCFRAGSAMLLTLLKDEVFELNSHSLLPLSNTLTRGYENVYPINDTDYLIGTEDGFVLYKDQETGLEDELPNLDISGVECLINENGKITEQGLPIKRGKKMTLQKLSYDQRHLVFSLAMPYFKNQELVKFQYRINDESWSNWINNNKIDLNRLAEGAYKLEIQASLNESEIISNTNIEFTIKPPLQRTWLAYILYYLVVSGLIYLAFHLVRKRLENQRRREIIDHQRMAIRREIKMKRKAQEVENELVKLRNEKLNDDVRHKSKELANTTMSIIKKNNILGEIKEVLIDFSKDDPSFKENNKLIRLIRKIDREIEHQDNWQVFEKNFDKVHENFLLKLKERHPGLTPKDLRLAAYLRMNLSSKEISPLMNISVRSIEISRYRLRKKMSLEKDQNLTDYLLTI